MIKKLACALLCAVVLGGCSAKSDNNNSGGVSSPVPETQAAVTYDTDEGAPPSEESERYSEPPATTTALTTASSIASPSESGSEGSSIPEEIYEPAGENSSAKEDGHYSEPPATTTALTTASSITSPSESEPEGSSAPEEIYESAEESGSAEVWYTFRRQDLFDDHYKKHGAEFGDITQQEYLEMANALIASEGSPDVLTKYSDDGDYMYFNTVTEEFLVLSEDGYIRTYFIPTAGIKYWNRQ